jgi:transcriptional regulator with XRE-family HTH domain
MRKKSGKSQKVMAKHIKVSLRQYQYMEAGEQDIKAGQLFKLASFCGYHGVNKMLNDLSDFFRE